MRYLVLLVDDEATGPEPGTPEWDADMEGFVRFEELAGDAILGGEALWPSAAATTIRAGHDGAPLVTAGPFVEAAEVVGGFFVLEAADLDAALELTARIPTAATGRIEVRPFVEWTDRGPGEAGTEARPRHLAVIWSEETPAEQPGTPEWDEDAAAHARFTEAAAPTLRAGGALHPAATATTVRVRDGEVVVTDGPFTAALEVIGGLYLFDATSPQEAVALASAIPCNPGGAVELRPIMEVE